MHRSPTLFIRYAQRVQGLRMWLVVGMLVSMLGFVGGCGGDEGSDAEPAENVAQTEEAESEPDPLPIDLTVSSPGHGDVIKRHVAVVKGRVEPADATVEINGGPVRDAGNGRFTKRVRLVLGDNDIEISASAPDHEDADQLVTVKRKRNAAELAAFRQAREERRAREEAERIQRIADYKAGAQTIPYNQLEKNPERHKGTVVKYQGQIFQIQEEGYGGWMLLSVTNEGYGFWDDNIYVEYDGTIDSAEEDIITVYGKVRGTYTYETQIGGETFVPHVRAKFIEE